jgi:hypothetical protein
MSPTVRFEIFRGVLASWDELMEQAAAFATTVGPERLISISHSEDKDDGVIAVWFWAEDRYPSLDVSRVSIPPGPALRY